MKFQVRLDGHEQQMEVVRQGDRLRIKWDGRTIEAYIVHRDGPTFVLEYEQRVGDRVLRRRLRAAGHVQGDGRQLWVNGTLLAYERVREQGAAGPPAAASLSASIPAVVSEVLVAEGETVTAGQKLILLESMKMILPIQAPHDGLVTAVHCAPGDAVQPGVALVELDAAD